MDETCFNSDSSPRIIRFVWRRPSIIECSMVLHIISTTPVQFSPTRVARLELSLRTVPTFFCSQYMVCNGTIWVDNTRKENNHISRLLSYPFLCMHSDRSFKWRFQMWLKGSLKLLSAQYRWRNPRRLPDRGPKAEWRFLFRLYRTEKDGQFECHKRQRTLQLWAKGDWKGEKKRSLKDGKIDNGFKNRVKN